MTLLTRIKALFTRKPSPYMRGQMFLPLTADERAMLERLTQK